MKKLLLVAILATFAVVLNVETAKAQSVTYGYVAITKDTIVTGDTGILAPGLNLYTAADTLNALVIKLPTGSQIKSGQIYRVTVTKGITNVTYINGTGVSLPTAIKVQQNHSLNNAKIVADGGSFGLLYNKTTHFWYRVE